MGLRAEGGQTKDLLRGQVLVESVLCNGIGQIGSGDWIDNWIDGN